MLNILFYEKKHICVDIDKLCCIMRNEDIEFHLYKKSIFLVIRFLT